MLKKRQQHQNTTPIHIYLHSGLLAIEWVFLHLEVTELKKKSAELRQIIDSYVHNYNVVLGSIVQEYLVWKMKLLELSIKSGYGNHAQDLQELEQLQQLQKKVNNSINGIPDIATGNNVSDPEKQFEEMAAEIGGELKHLYRTGIKLCHPDKVDHRKKKQAEKVFHDLRLAFIRKELGKMRIIVRSLQNGLLEKENQFGAMQYLALIQMLMLEKDEHSKLVSELYYHPDLEKAMQPDRESILADEKNQFLRLINDIKNAYNQLVQINKTKNLG